MLYIFLIGSINPTSYFKNSLHFVILSNIGVDILIYHEKEDMGHLLTLDAGRLK